MSKPAARVNDLHMCPQLTVLIPHIGGTILPPGCPEVKIGNQNAVRVGDDACCVGPTNTIAMGSATVYIGGAPQARMGDLMAHGGIIVTGDFAVMIGGPDIIGNPVRAGQFFPGQQTQKDTCALMSTQGIVHQHTGVAHSEAEMQQIGAASGAYTACNGTVNEAQVMTGAGIPATMTQDPSLNDIRDAVREGRAVIVGYDARPVWGDNSPKPLGHAVRVTGVEVDADGNPTAFYINDTGSGQKNQRVPAATFQQALDGFGGGRMATSDQPIR